MAKRRITTLIKHENVISCRFSNRLFWTIVGVFAILSAASKSNYLDVSDGFLYSNHSIFRTCDSYMFAFAKYTTEFIHCALVNARPFRVCEECAVAYVKTNTIYADLKKDNGHWSGCKELLLHADMVQVLSRTQMFAEDLWTKSQCNKCFSKLKENFTHGTVKAELSHSTKIFMHLYNDTLKCFNESDNMRWDPFSGDTFGNSSVCERCVAQYTTLGRYFLKMTDNWSVGLCMDLVDIMNYTRLKWSDEYHCSNRTGSQGPIIAIAVIVGIIPVVFYIGNRLHGENTIRRIVRQKRLKRTQVVGSISESMYTLNSDTDESSPLVLESGARAGYGSNNTVRT